MPATYAPIWHVIVFYGCLTCIKIIAETLNKIISLNWEERDMSVFGELFNDLTGWLTVGIIVFMLVMMTFLFSMFINKSSKHDK